MLGGYLFITSAGLEIKKSRIRLCDKGMTDWLKKPARTKYRWTSPVSSERNYRNWDWEGPAQTFKYSPPSLAKGP